ncbi:MAG: DUF222 domain-containing protein [Actinomycetota bacterium]
MATLPATSTRAATTQTSFRVVDGHGRARVVRQERGTYRRPGSGARICPDLSSERAGSWSAQRDAPTTRRADEELVAEGASELSDSEDGRDAHHRARGGEARDLDGLDGAVTQAIGLDLDRLSEEGLAERLDRLHRPIARLSAERARITAELERRRVSASGEPAGRAAARRELRRQLAERTNSTPGATKRDADAGRFADRHPTTGASFADGALSADHVRVIGDTLAMLPPDRHDAVETELLAVAHRTNPTLFGKHAREVLAREAPSGSDRVARGQHRQRRVRSYDTSDGGLAFSGLLYGDMAETARAALDAFRRPDTPDEHRSPEQRSADAFEQLCASALRVGDAPTRHGVRPHVIITVTADQLVLGDRGVAQFGSGQPATIRQLRTLLADCSWGRVVLGPDSTPIEASKAVRTVPAGLWRVLVARDEGCTWRGCDAPPAWCDVAHGTVAFTDGGRLSPANAALLCRRHHRRFDLGSWQISIQGGEVHYHREQDASEPVPGLARPTVPQTRAPSPGSARQSEGPARRQPRARGRPQRGPAKAPPTERPAATMSGGPGGTDVTQPALPIPPELADP